ncbi:hypothetical protein KQI84_05900 [bacterium]|nr:hypothetical protein [bacterium]
MPLLIAGLATLLLLIPILVTNFQDGKAGSPLAWIFVVGVGFAHLPLAIWWKPLRRFIDPPETPTLLRTPVKRLHIGILAAGLIALSAIVLINENALVGGIFERPVDPGAGGSLPLMAQVCNRLLQGLPLYEQRYEMTSYSTLNSYAPGMPLPFALARSLGFDWRFATVGALVLLLPMLAAGLTMLFRATADWNAWKRSVMLLGFPAIAIGWMVLPLGKDYLLDGSAPPIWPFILLFALALSARAHLLASICMSVLAAMSIGWLMLLPLYIGLVWNEDRRLAPTCTFMALLLPLLLYGLQLNSFHDLIRGALGETLAGGNFQAEQGLTYRMPFLTGLWDFVAMRSLLFVLVLVALMRIAMALMDAEMPRRRRLELFALAGFLVICASPIAFYYHYYAHLLLLAGLMPGWAGASLKSEPSPPKAPEIALPAVLAVAAALLPAWTLSRIADEPIDTSPDLHFRDVLSTGWYPPGEDSTWGAALRPTLSVPLARSAPAVLNLHLGVLENPNGPANRVRVSVNGLPTATWFPTDSPFGVLSVVCDDGELFTGANSVALDVDWSESPTSLGIGHDDRPLSVFFGGLTYQPLESEP